VENTKQLGELVEQAASASGPVASGSQSLAEGTTEQAANIQETSSAPEEMSSIQTDPSFSAAGDDKEIPIDWSTMMNNLENEEMIMDTVKIFTEDAPQTIQNLNGAVKVKNSEDVQLYAHSLRGISAMIGANRLRENARQLECAGEVKMIEAFDLFFKGIKEDFDKVVTFLSEANWVEIAKEHDHNKQQVG